MSPINQKPSTTALLLEQGLLPLLINNKFIQELLGIAAGYIAHEQTKEVSVLFQHDAHAALSLVYCACDERMVINSASEGIE